VIRAFYQYFSGELFYRVERGNWFI